jgi:hypothetical protein
MENFFNYLTQPLEYNEVDIWFRSNNIVFEKMDLFFDFTYTLVIVIYDTYLGGNNEDSESKVEMSEEDNTNHFNWCWKETIKTFEKENILINESGEHYEYFKDFFKEIFYNHPEDKVKKSIPDFFVDMFDRKKTFTKSDLDVILTIYRAIDTNMTVIY